MTKGSTSYINMTEKEFNTVFNDVTLSEDGKAIAEFQPVFVKPTCNLCGGEMKKGEAGRFSSKETGLTIYKCKNYNCSGSTVPGRIKRVRIYYKVEEDNGRVHQVKYKSVSVDKLEKDKLRQGQVKEMGRIKAILKSYQALYKRGIDRRSKVEDSITACRLNKKEARDLVKARASEEKYASLEDVKEEHLKKVTEILNDYGFKKLRPAKYGKWNFQLYDYNKLYLEQLYEKEDTSEKILLRVPQQSEDKKTDSWFIVKGVAYIEEAKLLDSKGNEYLYPIPYSNPFEMRVYSWRHYTKIAIIRCSNCDKDIVTASSKEKAMREFRKINRCPECRVTLERENVKLIRKEDEDGISKRVPIDVAINRFRERIKEEFESKTRIKGEADEAKKMLMEISDIYPEKVGLVEIKKDTLTAFGHKKPDRVSSDYAGYLVIGNMNRYFVRLVPSKLGLIISVDIAGEDSEGNLAVKEQVARVPVDKNSASIYNKLSSVVYLLINDVNGIERLKKQGMKPLTQ